jgi:hypothetical protein
MQVTEILSLDGPPSSSAVCFIKLGMVRYINIRILCVFTIAILSPKTLAVLPKAK